MLRGMTMAVPLNVIPSLTDDADIALRVRDVQEGDRVATLASVIAKWQFPDDVVCVDARPLIATGSKLTLRQQRAGYELAEPR